MLWPVRLNSWPVSATARPVTQTAEVAVKRASSQEMVVSLQLNELCRRNAPMSIAPRKKKIGREMGAKILLNVLFIGT